MFEYVLLLQVCSALNSNCLPEIRYPKNLKTHKECVTAGFRTGKTMIEGIDTKTANKEKIFIRFTCHEIEVVKS